MPIPIAASVLDQSVHTILWMDAAWLKPPLQTACWSQILVSYDLLLSPILVIPAECWYDPL